MQLYRILVNVSAGCQLYRILMFWQDAKCSCIGSDPDHCLLLDPDHTLYLYTGLLRFSHLCANTQLSPDVLPDDGL